MKNRILCLAVVAVVLLTMGAAYGVTAAWLGRSRQVDAGSIRLQVNAGGLKIVNFKIFQCDEASTQNPYPYREVTAPTMAPYDSIFVNRNDYHGLILAVELAGIPQGTAFVNATFERTSPSDDTSTSKITRLACYRPGSASSYADATTNAGLHTARQYLYKNPGWVSFGAGNSLTIAVSTDNSLTADGAMVALFLLDYDPVKIPAVNIFENTGSQEVELTGQVIPYQNDLAKLTFSLPG